MHKCLTCAAGQRGKPLVYCDGFLECGCPVETAVLELWMTKITGNFAEDVPQRTDPEKGDGVKGADFNFSVQNLHMIAGAIREVSGLTPSTMFCNRQERINRTLAWIIDRSLQLMPAHSETLDREGKRFQRIIEKCWSDSDQQADSD